MEWGIMVIFVMVLSVFFEFWMGMLVGIILIIVLCGFKVFILNYKIEEFGLIDKYEFLFGVLVELVGVVFDVFFCGNIDFCDVVIVDYCRRVVLEN